MNACTATMRPHASALAAISSQVSSKGRVYFPWENRSARRTCSLLDGGSTLHVLDVIHPAASLASDGIFRSVALAAFLRARCLGDIPVVNFFLPDQWPINADPKDTLCSCNDDTAAAGCKQ